MQTSSPRSRKRTPRFRADGCVRTLREVLDVHGDRGRVQREDRVINIVGKRFRELKTDKLAARSRDFH